MMKNIFLRGAAAAALIWSMSATAGSEAVAPAVHQTSIVGDASRQVDIRDFGGVCNGVVDNTAKLLSFFANNATVRGVLVIPPNCKFSISSVYPFAPRGLIIQDDSSINTGQPPGYKNKSRTTFTNDAEADDMVTNYASSHHPAIRLNNTHTARSSSARASYHSIIFAHGFRWNNDPIDGMQYLTMSSPRGPMWRSSWILNTKFQYAANPNPWLAATAYALKAIVNTADGNVYQATSAGTSGRTRPTHTRGSATDGTVRWQFLGPWSAGQTNFYFDEDGYGGVSGAAAGRWGAETNSKKGLSINVADASGDVFLRDDQRNADLWRLSTANGLQTGAIASLAYGGALAGATPTLSTNFHAVKNGAAVNMTNLLLPGGQVRAGIVYLYFANPNTTLVHAGGNFNLKGAANVTPPTGAIMAFLLEPNLSGAWIEVSRNF